VIGSLIGFIELGGVVLAWMIFWTYLIKSWTAHHRDSKPAQGLAAVFHA
jgi:hypothetical protein